MIKLEASKMTKAIEKAKAIHPRVSCIGERTYKVTSSDGKGSYTVRFVVSNGLKLAECDCKAGKVSQVCFHVAAASAVNIGLQRMKQQVAAAPAAPPSPVAIPSPTKPQPKFNPARIVYSVYVCPNTLRRIPACTVDGWNV
jgi:hypothetical protein